jgi:glucokinase
MIAALDIGGTKIAAGLVDEMGRVLASDQSPTVPEKGFDDALQRILTMLKSLQQRTGPIQGIGIGCTGPVDPFTGTIGTAELLRGWEGSPIVECLSCEFHVPVAMENDADAVALSEALWGPGRGAECLVYITIGTGIGGGIVRGGELYRGAAGAHPEIGHMAVDLGAGPRCYCGLTGCWESLASGRALEAWYGERLSGEDICRRARDGEPKAHEAVERVARYIGIGLVNVVTVYCPDIVLLGGGVMRTSGLFLEEIRRIVYECATQVPTDHLRIDVVESSVHAGLQGAAAVWLHRYEKVRRAS